MNHPHNPNARRSSLPALFCALTACAGMPLQGNAATVAAAPAQACLKELGAFEATLPTEGYWLGSSSYGFGVPVYGYGYTYGGRFGDSGTYTRGRPGYNVHTLLAAARILAQSGLQPACENVLSAARDSYAAYRAELRSGQVPPADVTGWRRQQIETAAPVATNGVAYSSDQLIGTSIVNAQDEELGDVEDIVMSPQTGKIAYLLVGHGGFLGIDEKFTPVPWQDFKSPVGSNLLVLTVTKAALQSAPQVRKDPGNFAAEVPKVDTYWATHAPLAKN